MKDRHTQRKLSKKQNLVALYMIVAGIAFNMTLSSVMTALGLPLYLDTVGTVIVAVLGGYLPGVIVGFATNLLKTISDPSSLYYGVLNVLIAFFAAFFWRTRLAQKMAWEPGDDSRIYPDRRGNGIAYPMVYGRIILRQ